MNNNNNKKAQWDMVLRWSFYILAFLGLLGIFIFFTSKNIWKGVISLIGG
ncbi:MAG: hypothetical protein ABIG89_06265 [Candidatus Woesearchaeota archaeon]